MNKEIRISVVTAAFNAEDDIKGLIESLANQSDQNFEWVVADGGSVDNTVSILESVKNLRVKIVSGPDFGIYDALNKAIKDADCDYYIVAGADDRFDKNAIANFRSEAMNDEDIVAANVKAGGALQTPRRKKPAWLVSQKKYISSHSLGTMIKKNLHERYGYYSRRFPIAADQKFLMDVCFKGKCKVRNCNFISGQFSQAGVSSTDLLGTITEFYRVQVELGMNKLVQLALMVYKIIFIAYRNDKK